MAAGKYAKKTNNDSVLKLLKDINSVIMEIINMFMKLAPIGIFALLAPVAGNTGLEVIIPMLKFLLALLLADLIMFALYMPYAATKTGLSLFKMPKKFAKMAIMALTTTSGAVSSNKDVRYGY